MIRLEINCCANVNLTWRASASATSCCHFWTKHTGKPLVVYHLQVQKFLIHYMPMPVTPTNRWWLHSQSASNYKTRASVEKYVRKFFFFFDWLDESSRHEDLIVPLCKSNSVLRWCVAPEALLILLQKLSCNVLVKKIIIHVFRVIRQALTLWFLKVAAPRGKNIIQASEKQSGCKTSRPRLRSRTSDSRSPYKGDKLK